MEIRKGRGFPQRLEALRLHSSPRPDGGDKLKSGTFYFALTVVIRRVSQQSEKFLFQQSRKFLFETGKLAG